MSTTNKATKTNKETNKETVIIAGVIKSAFTHVEKNDDGSIKSKTNVISLFADDNLSIDGSPKIWEFFEGFYQGLAPKWIPNWFKERSGISLKSSYNIPVMIVDTGDRLSFEEFVERGLIRGASVQIKCNVKDSAIYPSAMKVIADGEEYDAFKDF